MVGAETKTVAKPARSRGVLPGPACETSMALLQGIVRDARPVFARMRPDAISGRTTCQGERRRPGFPLPIRGFARKVAGQRSSGRRTVTESANELFGKLVRIMARLRGENGCPWDRQQTHESIKPYLVEETYEVLEAIDEGDAGKLCEELGDVMLQVVFHARMAEEA
ncbi:MAG: hypothetical protein EHM71_16025, partial [Zetaproteobacteria bacterium]